MSKPIIEVVTEVLIKIKNVDQAKVVPEAKLIDDLGADSLDAIEIILALETYYEKDFDGEDLENLKTVGDVVELVRSIVE